MNVKLLNKNAKVPTKGSKFSAGYDLYACLDSLIEINPHETKKVSTGVAVEIPIGTFGGVFARSGLATKQSLRPANCVGVIDPDYRGEIFVSIHNDSDTVKVIKPNDRVAQLILLPYEDVQLNVVDNLTETDRGTGGFGSTGA